MREAKCPFYVERDGRMVCQHDFYDCAATCPMHEFVAQYNRMAQELSGVRDVLEMERHLHGDRDTIKSVILKDLQKLTLDLGLNAE